MYLWDEGPTWARVKFHWCEMLTRLHDVHGNVQNKGVFFESARPYTPLLQCAADTMMPWITITTGVVLAVVFFVKHPFQSIDLKKAANHPSNYARFFI